MSLLVMNLALPGWISGANAANPGSMKWQGRFHYARYDFSFDRRSGRKGHRHWASTPLVTCHLPTSVERGSEPAACRSLAWHRQSNCLVFKSKEDRFPYLRGRVKAVGECL
jgi:hypothetical protein